MSRLNANNLADTELDGAITDTDTSITVLDASVFPSTPFRATIDDGSSVEIVEVSSVSSNTLTVSRGVEGTSAQAWNDGVLIEQRFTAGMHSELVGDNISISAGTHLTGGGDLTSSRTLNVDETGIDVENLSTSSTVSGEVPVSQGDGSLAMQEVSADNTIRQSQTEFETFIESSDFANNGVDEPLLLGSIVSSAPAIDAVASSQTAMDAVAASQTAMDTVAGSQLAMDTVAASQTAMDAVIASQLALDTVVASQTAMDAVAASQLAMDAVAASQTAMDTVAASQTARDVIGFSGLAYDTIAASNMAIGKYAIGYTTENPVDYADMDAVAASQTAMDAVAGSQLAMDAVAGSQLAMDAVAASQTAMDAVLQSPTALGKLLLSANINTSVWASNTGSESFWDVNGDLADSQWGLDPDSRHGGQSLFIDCDNIPSGGDYISWTVDLTDASTLSVWEKTLDVRATNFEIIVGGTTEFTAANNNTAFEERSVDVSSYTGNTTVQIGLADTDDNGRETLVSDLSLS